MPERINIRVKKVEKDIVDSQFQPWKMELEQVPCRVQKSWNRHCALKQYFSATWIEVIMNEEKAFLKAIAKNPKDKMARMVFAGAWDVEYAKKEIKAALAILTKL